MSYTSGPTLQHFELCWFGARNRRKSLKSCLHLPTEKCQQNKPGCGLLSDGDPELWVYSKYAQLLRHLRLTQEPDLVNTGVAIPGKDSRRQKAPAVEDLRGYPE